MNGVVKLNSGQLARPKERIEHDILKKKLRISLIYINIAEKMIYLNILARFAGTWRPEYSIPFIYIATPDPVSLYDQVLPIGVNCYNNDDADIFIKALINMEVPYIDLREPFYEDGLSQYDYFSKTDHHWNAYGGHYVYLKIAEWLEDNGVTIDKKMNIESFGIVVYKDKLLGSMGQRIGRFYEGCDDFYILNLNSIRLYPYEEEW